MFLMRKVANDLKHRSSLGRQQCKPVTLSITTLFSCYVAKEGSTNTGLEEFVVRKKGSLPRLPTAHNKKTKSL